MKIFISLFLLVLMASGCRNNPRPGSRTTGAGSMKFPPEMTDFTPYQNNPVFKGTGTDTWDQKIRERGYILREKDTYYLWYTGYGGDESAEKHLGLATSTDGLVWTRYPDNPIYDVGWVEDMSVINHNGTYYMFAEGRGDTAHMLTSADRIHWEEKGPLDIHYSDGKPLSPGAYGTPTIWFEDGTWYLFYEREDLGIWLATSPDLKVWTNKQDDPVIAMGPEEYDRFGLALDQVIKYKGRYFAYYHATEYEDWHEWTSCVAGSDDLIHWEKYSGNPIMRDNKSSPIMVYNGEKYLLYTMHPDVCVHFPVK
jgi:predicted GH43/DUF377 family glycosyl hydrolase